MTSHNNNLFIQRRFHVQKDSDTGVVNFIGSLYIAYYFYVNEELYVSKYALCVKYAKTMEEIKELINKH